MSYLTTVATGLAEAHGWPAEHSAEYLATRPGAAGHWTPRTVLAALRHSAGDGHRDSW